MRAPTRRFRTTVACLPILAFCACASLDPTPAFEDVREDVAARAGLETHWITGSEEDAEAARSVDRLLADGVQLEESVQIALLGNRRLQGAYERLGVAQADVVQAGLLKNPIFDAELKFIGDVPGTEATLEMSVVQDFLDVLMIPARRRVAEARLARVRTEVTAAVLDHAADVKVAFVELQAAERTLAMRREILRSTDASYDAARRLHRAGNITDLSLARERALHEQSRLAVASAETEVSLARERLNALMGLWGDWTRWSLAETLPELPDEEMDLAELESRAIEASLDLAMLRRQMQVVAAESGLEIAEAAWPELAAGAAAEYESPEEKWLGGPAVAVGVPIFDRGQARRAAANHRLRRLWNHFAALGVEVRAAARAARVRLLDARRQAEYRRRVVLPLAEQITAETQLEYNAMQLGVFELLQAKRREIDTRRRSILARKNYWIARFEIEQILAGRLVRGSAVSASVAGAGGMGRGGDGGH